MSPTRARLLLAVVAMIAVVSVAVARSTSAEQASVVLAAGASRTLPVLGGAAPPVTSQQWLNTEPLSAADLAGKVVLYDFWTFGCINCRNTLPFVEAMHERYGADGLVVLSIHTPEFDHEADPAAIESFVGEHGLTYPVALDPEKQVWRAFDNHYWPAFYLHDRSGDRRYVHFGEGAYDETEAAIRGLLGVDPASPGASWA